MYEHGCLFTASEEDIMLKRISRIYVQHRVCTVSGRPIDRTLSVPYGYYRESLSGGFTVYAQA
jgi:hypothetical protein